MKLSDKTVTILKNFSTINQNILFKSGSHLRTISPMKNILAEVVIDEEIPREFGIYDLNQFLNALSLHPNAELDLSNNDYLVIKEGKSRSKYFFADPNVLIIPPEKSISLPSEDVCFVMDTKEIDKLRKASSVYQVPDLSVIGEAGVVKLVVRDKKNETSNVFSIIVGETNSEFCANFKVENLKILNGTYEVVISSKLLSRFTNTGCDLVYYVAMEPDSEF